MADPDTDLTDNLTDDQKEKQREERALELPRQFPPVVLAENMWRECVRDEWQMAPNPILRLKGNDHG